MKIKDKSQITNIIIELLKNPTNSTRIQFLRYVFVGGAAFIVDFFSLFLLTDYFGIYYIISAALAFSLGLVTNYLLSIKWVFNQRNIDNKTIEFSLFAFIGIIGLGLNEIFIWFFTSKLGIYYMISKIITAIIILFWNFFARKLTLFQ
ncbi:MAG TPA: GtrA family protein [Methanobacterium sp.]|jgi:putative flippase GtrA|nr:GtrA family protein [Methanobacterium sp.]HOI39168.1 GtrA family protein [Methanobacterium sp.]